MSSFSIQALNSTLTALLPKGYAGKLCVGFSGGVDSSALLHALAELGSTNTDWSIRAVHIDHQLQSVSSDWAAQCQRVAANLGIALSIERVTIARDDPQGLEAAARRARYAVFHRVLQDKEMLLTAHHADDQAETLLLALMRGSGVQGLAAMPAIKLFGSGWHLRPLLHFTRNDIEVWAQTRGIEAINDPSNSLVRHDRNYLRHEVVPRLQERWPTMAHSVVRSASHLGEALGLLEEVAVVDLRFCAVDRAISIAALRSLSDARRRNVLRYWLRARGLPLPSTRKLLGLEQDLFNSDPARIPMTTWRGAELRWHRGMLYADIPRATLLPKFEQSWQWRDGFDLPAALGRVSFVPLLGQGLSAAKLPESVQIRFRKGGEKIRLSGRQHRHTLRNLLQESDVLPWWRDSLPLIFAGKQLIAVGDLYIADDFAAAPGEVALRVHWDGAPEWKAVVLDA
jgi:tRNA(Ile)-lysidine synthase